MLPYSSQHGKTMPLARASAEKIADRLLKVTPRHNAEYALEQASVLLDCVYKMTLDAGVDGNGKIVWRTHYLSGIAKAPVEDIARDDDGTRSLVLLDHGWEAGRVPPHPETAKLQVRRSLWNLAMRPERCAAGLPRKAALRTSSYPTLLKGRYFHNASGILNDPSAH